MADPLLFLRIRAAFPQHPPPQRQGSSGLSGLPPSPHLLPAEWDEPQIVQAFLRSYAATCVKVQGRGDAEASTAGEGREDGGEGDARGAATATASSSSDDSDGGGGGGGGGLLMMDGQLAMSRSAFFGRMKKIMRCVVVCGGDRGGSNGGVDRVRKNHA